MKKTVLIIGVFLAVVSLTPNAQTKFRETKVNQFAFHLAGKIIVTYSATEDILNITTEADTDHMVVCMPKQASNVLYLTTGGSSTWPTTTAPVSTKTSQLRSCRTVAEWLAK